MLLGLSRSLRSLTASPITAALDQAHRMALRAGGSISGNRIDDHHGDYVLPADVEPAEMAKAIAGKLRQVGGSAREPAIQRRKDGRVVVPAEFVKRLGGGVLDRGRRFLDRVIDETRATPGAATRQLSTPGFGPEAVASFGVGPRPAASIASGSASSMARRQLPQTRHLPLAYYPFGPLEKRSFTG